MNWIHKMVLYRYLDAEAAELTLKSGLLKTSLCSEFNDPFELAWQPEPSASDFLKLNKDYLSQLENSGLSEDQVVGDLNQLAKAFLQIRLKEFDQVNRIVCFTADNVKPANEILLWAHYSEKHSGIRLCFDLDKIRNGVLFKMDYVEDLLKINIIKKDSSEIEKNIWELYKRKAISWSYEEEVRFYVATKFCEEHSINESGKNAHFIKIKDGELSSVTFGMKFNGDIEKLKQYALKLNPEVKFYKAEQDLYAYKLNYISL